MKHCNIDLIVFKHCNIDLIVFKHCNIDLIVFKHCNIDLIVFQFPLIVPISFLVACSFLLIVPLYAAPVDTGFGVLIVCTGIPVYLLGVLWKGKPKAFTDLVGTYDVIQNIVFFEYRVNPFASGVPNWPCSCMWKYFDDKVIFFLEAQGSTLTMVLWPQVSKKIPKWLRASKRPQLVLQGH